MKILLIQPAKPEKAIGGEDIAIFEPLALEYLASGVKAHHDVKILDMRIDNDLDTVLNSFRPDVVGITAYTVHVNTVKRLFDKVKKTNPGIFTIVGGHHATIAHDDFYTDAVDMIVLGEGVFIFKEAIERLDRKTGLTGIPGTALRTGGTFILNKADRMCDLDVFPFPDRSLTQQYRGKYFSEWMKPLASIRTSKGCVFRCNFCALWKLTGGRYLARKPELIVEELGQIEEDFVFFADDESLLDAERMKALAGLIQRSGIRKRYFLYGRSDTIVNNPGLIETWKAAGLERVFVGLEFFSDRYLKEIHKGTTVNNNTEAVRILKSLDIDIFPNFIVNPDFERNDFRDLRKYCLSLDLDFIGFSVLTPLPGTDLYEKVRDSLILRDYDYCDFFHTYMPTKLPLNEFYREYVDLFSRTRSISSKISLLRKYHIKEIPSLLMLIHKFIKRLKNIHKDYPGSV